MRNKRGQFYIIGALIIIAIIAGLAATANYSKQKRFNELYDLGEELKIESEKVLDYGVYNKLDEIGMNELLTNFTKIYSKYKGNKRDLFFAFGNKEKLIIAGYVGENSGEIEKSEVLKKVKLKIPGQDTEYETLNINSQGNYTYKEYLLDNHKKIILNVEEINYHFELGEGDYFYFIIAEKINEQHYIVTNEE